MKVYLVYWCNNDTWEDYSESVEAAFSTRESAERYIASKGYRPHKYVSDWERENFPGLWDKRIDEWNEYSMWVREMEVTR